jgi:hypothetical protein
MAAASAEHTTWLLTNPPTPLPFLATGCPCADDDLDARLAVLRKKSGAGEGAKAAKRKGSSSSSSAESGSSSSSSSSSAGELRGVCLLWTAAAPAAVTVQ